MYLGTESQSYKCATSTLLYFSEDATSDSRLRDCLIQRGFRLCVVETAQEAANMLLSAFSADALVIRQDHIDTGSMIGLAFKLLSPLVPVILLSAQPPLSSVVPLGVDALFCEEVQACDAARRMPIPSGNS